MTSVTARAMDTLRRADRDRYLSVLYAPEDERGALFALYAFDAEIASVRDRIREPLPGEIRLQWWRDAIANEAGQGHPLADALIATIRAHNLPKKAFDDYLEARIFDLYDDPMPDRAALEGYCGETASALIQLAALILDPNAAPAASEAAGHAGCAQAITGMLRLLPLHRARGQCYLPKDILTASGLTPETFIAGQDRAAASRAVDALAALASEHLNRFQRLAPVLPKQLAPAFLPLAITGAYLGKIAGAPATSLDKSVDISNVRRHWLMLRKAGGLA